MQELLNVKAVCAFSLLVSVYRLCDVA